MVDHPLLHFYKQVGKSSRTAFPQWYDDCVDQFRKGEMMRTPLLFAALALILATLACNLPSNVPVTEMPTLSLPFTPTATLLLPTVLPTFTSPPTNTVPPPPTNTPTVPIVSPNGINVNCRLGPGTGWVPLSALVVGQTAQVTGRSTDGTWWLVNDPLNPGRGCWVAASVVVTGGNLSGIGVVQSPTATVTNVTINTDPSVVSVPGCTGSNPTIKINGTIETNGPTEVKWRFETQQGGAMPNQVTAFDTFGEQKFSVEFTPTIAVGTYSVKLVVLSPNSTQAEGSYRIECP
jgi:hypothetical protein